MERYFEDVELGDDVGPMETTISTEQVVQFTRIWGQSDRPSRFNSAEKAISEGLDGAVVPGVMHMGYVSRLITEWADSVTLKHLDVIWRQFVPHNAALKLHGIITDMREEDGEGILEADIYLDAVDGPRHVTGKAVFSLPMRGG